MTFSKFKFSHIHYRTALLLTVTSTGNCIEDVDMEYLKITSRHNYSFAGMRRNKVGGAIWPFLLDLAFGPPWEKRIK